MIDIISLLDIIGVILIFIGLILSHVELDYVLTQNPKKTLNNGLYVVIIGTITEIIAFILVILTNCN